MITFCEYHKWKTPYLSDWMDLGVTQKSRDHDAGHPKIKTKSCSVFKSVKSHGPQPNVETNRLLILVCYVMRNVMLNIFYIESTYLKVNRL